MSHPTSQTNRFADPATYEKTRLPVSEAVTLIPAAYFDEDFFSLERERVWKSGWVCVGYASQLPRVGDILRVELAGESLLIVRDKESRLQGFYNVCRHRGAELVSEEKTHCSVIRCPYHGWGYALDGRLLGAPYFQGLDIPAGVKAQFHIRAEEQGTFCKDDFGLHAFPVETWGGMIFVNLHADAGAATVVVGRFAQAILPAPIRRTRLGAS